MGTNSPKLPVQQLVTLAICRLAEPVVLTSVLPYLPEMLEHVGVPRNRLGKWVGITSATTAFSQGVTSTLWGAASDVWGRKPVILVGLASTMMLSIVFGLSNTLTQLIVARALIGLMNGNVGILRTMVAEMVLEPLLQPRAYSVMPLVWTIGCILGPSIGGGLARPADRFPSIFSGPWRKFPFLLPNLISSCFFLMGIVTGTLFLRETLASRKNSRDYGLILGRKLTRLCSRDRATKANEHGEREPLLGPTDAIQFTQSGQEVGRPRWRDVLSSQSNLVLLVYTMLGLHTMAFDTLLPVFLHLDVQSLHGNPDVQLPWKFAGGLGMDSWTIGTMSTTIGAFGFLLQLWIFPHVVKRYGAFQCLQAASMVYPFLYLVMPFTPLLPSPARPVGVCLIMFAKLVATTFAFPCCTIQLTNSAASLRVLGTLNGIATSVSSFGRAVGPAVVGGCFSFGVERGYIIFPWWIMSIFSILSLIPLVWITGSHPPCLRNETDG